MNQRNTTALNAAKVIYYIIFFASPFLLLYEGNPVFSNIPDSFFKVPAQAATIIYVGYMLFFALHALYLYPTHYVREVKRQTALIFLIAFILIFLWISFSHAPKQLAGEFSKIMDIEIRENAFTVYKTALHTINISCAFLTIVGTVFYEALNMKKMSDYLTDMLEAVLRSS